MLQLAGLLFLQDRLILSGCGDLAFIIRCVLAIIMESGKAAPRGQANDVSCRSSLTWAGACTIIVLV